MQLKVNLMVDDVLEAAEPAAQKLQEFDGKVRLVGQFDADGISATAVAHELLSRLDVDFEYEILEQLYEEDVERLAQEDEQLLFFVDIGSGQSRAIQQHIVEEAGKQVVVSDHHTPEVEGDSPGVSNFLHLNPHFLGIDGGEAISAAGTTYLLAESIDEGNKDLLPYALIGATGDVQKQDGEFLGLNRQLAEKAVENGLVEKRQGLDLYGRTTKPLHKSLMYTTDPELPGITNSESGAIQFLKSAGIDLRANGGFRTLSDLTEQEEKKLIHEMIKQGYPVEELIQPVYTLQNGYEIDEFSTVINACGRLGSPRKGVRILLEDDMELAEKISGKYSRRISDALSYVEENRDNDNVVYESGIGVIDAGSGIDENFIGTVATIVMGNGLFSSPVVAGMAEADESKVKVSTRATKDAVENGLNLGDVVSDICEEVDGEGGGHNIAAGAKIPESEKQRFVESLESAVSSRTG